jgi:hypothetical protein
VFFVECDVSSSHSGVDGDRGRPAYAEVSEEVTAAILGTEVTMEVECTYGMVVTIYQTIRCHNPIGHSVLYEIIWHGEFLSIAIDMLFYFFFAIETLLI